MRTIIFISTFLVAINTSFGQLPEKIKSIQKLVEIINNDTGYTIKALSNDYFIDKKNESTDGGQELKGYYKGKKLKKIIYSVGISVCMRTYEYYLSDSNLIFVFEKEFDYPEIKDSSGEYVLDYSKTVPAFEGRYYFNNGKIIQFKNKGHERLSDDRKTKENMFLGDVKNFLEDLKNN